MRIPLLIAGVWMVACVAASADDVAPRADESDIPNTPADASSAVEIPDEILAPVRHPVLGLFSKGIRPVEADSYYFILNKAREVDEAAQKKAARTFLATRRAAWRANKKALPDESPFPVFVDLYENRKNPVIYHGKLVTLTGRLRRLISYPAGTNTYGIDTLYEAWLYTDDSQGHPAVVVCTEIPDDIPRGANILVDRASTTGYFFKMYVYEGQEEPLWAPMILAKKLEWRGDSPSVVPRIPTSLAYALTGLAGIIVIGVLWRVSRRDRLFRQSSLHAVAEDEPIDFDHLSDGDDSPSSETFN